MMWICKVCGRTSERRYCVPCDRQLEIQELTAEEEEVPLSDEGDKD